MAGAPMLDEHVREKADVEGLSAEWNGYSWRCLGDPVAVYEVKGAVAPIITRGKRKGQRDWKRMDRATGRTFYVTTTEHVAWLESYERNTGRCFNCAGDAKEFAGWSVNQGMWYRPCGRCNGTGSAPLSEPVAVEGGA